MATVQYNLPGTVLVSDGTVSNPELCFSGETTTGIYRPGSGELAVTVGGVSVKSFNTTSAPFFTAGQDLTAGDVVSLLNGSVYKGFTNGATKYIPSGVFNSFPVASVKIDESTFLLLWVDAQNHSQILYASLATIAAGAITFGTATQIATGVSTTYSSTGYLAADLLPGAATTTIIVAYKTTGNAGMAVVVNVSGGTITSGTAAQYVGTSGASSMSIRVVGFTSTGFVVVAPDGTNSSKLTAWGGSISGTTITFAVGVVLVGFTVNAGAGFGVYAVALSTTSLLAVCDYNSAGGIAAVQATYTDGSPPTVVAGTVTVRTTDVWLVKNVSMVAIPSSTNAVLIYRPNAANNNNNLADTSTGAIVISCPATTPSFNTPTYFNTGGNNNGSACTLIGSKLYVCLWNSDGGSTQLFVANVSGTTITFTQQNFTIYNGQVQCTTMFPTGTGTSLVITGSDTNYQGNAVAYLIGVNGDTITTGETTGRAPIGIATQSVTSGNKVRLAMKNDTYSGLSGLRSGHSYWAHSDGTIDTAGQNSSAQDRPFSLGTAMDSTTLLLSI